MSDQEIRLRITNAVLSCQILNEDLDLIQGQPFCRQELKASVKNVKKYLDKALENELMKLLDKNEMLVQNLLDNNSSLLKQIVSLTPAQRLEANQVLHDHFDQQKEHNIKLIDLTA